MALSRFARRLQALFHRRLAMAMTVIETALPGRSRRSLFRDLAALGYLTSYSNAGRYYTLPDIPRFDPDGLWEHQGVFFSRFGTLKATVEFMVDNSERGRTHAELQAGLRVRVHNTLLDLVREQHIGREVVGGQYLYVSSDPARAATQVARRLEQQPSPVPTAEAVSASTVIEVLLEVIHGARAKLDAAAVVSGLRARGSSATVEQVEEIFRRYGLEKKTPRSRSPRSRS